MNVGTAGQTAGTKTKSSQRSQASRPGQREVVETEAAEYLEVVRGAIVYTDIKDF
jgi:hypothetical protein